MGEGLGIAAAQAAARRNVVLLACGMAALHGMNELSAGAATLTFTEAGGSKSLAGFAPALFLLTGAATALPAGRAMDRYGRRPVLLAGFAAGLAGSLLAALGAAEGLLPVVLAGLALIGSSSATVMLSRVAAADMVPPERRPRTIALVLFGAVFGALLGPFIFIPLLQSSEGGGALAAAWVGAAGFMLAGLAVVSRVRPDPGVIARALGRADPQESAPVRGLRELVAQPGVPPALLASVACWSSMVAVMVLMGVAMVDHGHSQSSVFPVIAAHFVGMFGLFAVVGPVIERIGRTHALAAGLLLLAGSSLSMIGAIESVALSAAALFGVGLGWNIAYVAATAALSERTTVAERGGLLGLGDLLAGLTGATLAVLGGLGLDRAGIEPVVAALAVLPICSAVWILRTREPEAAIAG